MTPRPLSFVVALGLLTCHRSEPIPEATAAPDDAARTTATQDAKPTIVGRVTRAGAPVAGVRVSYSGVSDTAVVSGEAGEFELVVHDEEFAAAPAIYVILSEQDRQHTAVLRNAGGRIEGSFELDHVVGVSLRDASPEDQAWIDAHAWAEREWNEWAAPGDDVAAHLAQWQGVAATIAAEADEYRRGLLMAAQFRIGRGDPALGLDDPRWAIHFDSLPVAIYEAGRWEELTPRLDAMISEHPQPEVASDIALNRYLEATAEGRTEDAARLWQRWLDRPILNRTQFATAMLSLAPTRTLAPGQPLPDLCVEDLDGGRLCTADLRGDVTVIEIWTTWCTGCRKTAATLRDAHAALAGDRAPTFVSIELGNSVDTIRTFLAAEPMPWRHGWVREAELEAVRSRLQIGSYPTLLLVDADGTIIASSPELRAEDLVTEVRALELGD